MFALEYPSYEKIEDTYRIAGARVELLPMGADGIVSEALAKTSADVLHVSPYRSFPSGVTASASKKHEFLRWAGQGRRFVVEDDFESEFSLFRKTKETIFALSGDDNVVYLSTFSQPISPSLRVGYMVLPRKLVQRYDSRLGFYSCTVPTFEQLLLAELIGRGDFERRVNRVRRGKRQEARGERRNRVLGPKRRPHLPSLRYLLRPSLRVRSSCLILWLAAAVAIASVTRNVVVNSAQLPGLSTGNQPISTATAERTAYRQTPKAAIRSG